MLLDFLSVFAEAFLNAVLPVLAAALAALVVAWITEKVQVIKMRMTSQQRAIIDVAIKSAVYAAEQVHLKNAAIDKKNYALQVATAWLADRGIKVNLSELDTKIEAAVFESFNVNKGLYAQVPPTEPE